MNFFILDIKISGIKCIDKEIEIQFANKNLKPDDFKRSHIKAIYGTNGTGKSSIIHAMNLYYHSVVDPDYLIYENRNGNLKQIINQNTKSAYIDIYYGVNFDNNVVILHHRIEYACNEDSGVSISKEIFSYQSGFKWGDPNKETTIYVTEKGQITYLPKELEKVSDIIVKSSYNLLETSSLSVNMIKDVNINDLGATGQKYIIYDIVLAFNVMRINVFIDDKDFHKISIQKANQIIEQTNKIGGENLPPRYEFTIDYEVDDVEKTKIDSYKKEVDKIARFLKVFKPELEEIQIDSSPINDNQYRCKKILCYKNGTKVSSEYESNGIKKLMKLYPCLNNVELGGVVFIDEFDSNIHDVYLCKLVEYFANYTKGQFVFTTHNLGPMEVLGDSKLKHSIDFINNSKITSWKKNGNYSVVKLYRSGAIPSCPFSLNSADFVKTFGK